MLAQVAIPIIATLIAVAGTLLVERRRTAVTRRGQDVEAAAVEIDHQLQHEAFGLDVLQASLAELHTKAKTQGDEITVLSGRLDQCETDKHELRDEIEGMAEANRQMRISVDESRDERQRLGRRVNDLTAQLAELRQDVSSSTPKPGDR